MNTFVVLFCGELAPFALEPFAGGDSAFIRSLRAASSFAGNGSVLVCAARSRNSGYPAADPARLEALIAESGVSAGVHVEERWTTELFYSVLDREAGNADHAALFFGDCPCIDLALSRTLMDRHLTYAAEYTFADGYPAGLSPDILARGILPVLVRLSAGETGAVTRTTVFDTIKKDINSFDIETDIAPVDVRHLRMTLACDTRQNFLVSEAFHDISAETYAAMVETRAGKLRTVPAFYGIQTSGGCPFACNFCPYPEASLSRGTAVTERTDFMNREDFSRIVDKIAEYSRTAVVSLSLWGEPARHPDVAGLVADVLKHDGLSVLIETTGIGWTTETLDTIAAAAAEAGPRMTSLPAITWIVALDAAEAGQYGTLRGIQDTDRANTLFVEALSCIDSLAVRFPDDVWPQFVRMNENEEQLEQFYRYWKEKLSRVIVQKHDSFCKTKPDRRVADLSPLKRNPCWHLKRDMSILIDGTVPLCREDVYAKTSFGNAFTDDLAAIWNGYHSVYEQQTACVYEGICGACDEYYTYNF